MKRTSLVIGVLCLAVAAVVFVFTDGARRWYSGLFFAILGVAMLVTALRVRPGAGE